MQAPPEGKRKLNWPSSNTFPRLRGRGVALSQQGGGIGTRGRGKQS